MLRLKIYENLAKPLCVILPTNKATNRGLFMRRLTKVTMCEITCVGAEMAQNNSYAGCIEKNFELLVRSIDPSEQLLTQLSFINEFPRETISWVEEAVTHDDKNCRLLKTLHTTSTEIVDEFIRLLQSNEQQHVANVLLGNTDDWPMSQQHFDLLRNKKDQMFRYLNPSVDLLHFLESCKVLTCDDSDRIRCKHSDREMSDELVRVLKRKPDSAFNSFVEALRRTQQAHVAFILTGEGEEPITDRKRWLLDQSRCKLAENLEPIDSNLVDELLRRKVISDTEYQSITSEKSTPKQSICLVEIFKRKSQPAFDSFIQTLKDTRQEHVAEMIQGNVVSGTVELNRNSNEVHPALEEDMIREMNNQELLPAMHTDGIYSKAEKGSIKIRFSCLFPDSVTKLHKLYESGTIDKLLYEQHGYKFAERGLQSMKVNIPQSEFEKAESCALMTPEHRRLLQSTADKFAPTLRMTQQLLSGLSLCNRRRRAILSQPTEEERSRRLFDIVSRRPDPAFQQLVDALRNTGNTVVADHLRNEHKVSPQPPSTYPDGKKSPGSTKTPGDDDDKQAPGKGNDSVRWAIFLSCA